MIDYHPLDTPGSINAPLIEMATSLYETRLQGIMGVVFNKTYRRLGNTKYNYNDSLQGRFIGGIGHSFVACKLKAHISCDNWLAATGQIDLLISPIRFIKPV